MNSSKLLTGRIRVCIQQILYQSSSASVHGKISCTGVKDWHDIPGPSGLYSIPVIGPALHFKPFTKHVPERIHCLIDDLHEEYGPIVRVKLGRWRVLVEDINDIKTVFGNEGKYPNRPGVPVSIAYGERRNVRNGLENLEGADWEAVRKPCSISLSRPNSAIPYLHQQNQVAIEFAERVTKRAFSPEDLNKEFYKYTTETSCVITYNKKLGFLSDKMDENKELFLKFNDELMKIVNESIMGRTPLVRYFKTPSYKRYEEANDFILKTVNKYTRRLREEIDRKKKDGTFDPDEPNFLHHLITNTNLSEVDIDTLLHNFVVAGTDSTAKNLQVFFYNMATNKDKQEKLYKEIQNALGPQNDVTPEALAKMQYLRACVKESFRLHHPTSTGTIRVLPEDIVLGGYRIPKGIEIILSNQRLAKNPDIFDDPESYVPERWLRNVDGARQRPIPAMALLPFGFGPRNCVGRRFAEQEMYLAAIQILQRSEVDLEEDSEDMIVEYTTFITTKHPIPLIFKPRNG
ncbi:1,25-dihydroxyvitamin D(3) 24-hydroxylase, mitochondrial [Patella vulgata]|uniref:1,25-dihydroxyvitamin D(3) 24-hydroxylase, mitochondrial n=1 Tax=Patella vulgata TaxID=6465 RepID=UPI0024A9BC90|nr:1,25-dihydroxyvitamin D(3) 24-hydroxylase, mitochondrial [Patella vulgata]XP_050397896.2 1,25-dihydroxyvitamin D(3) 24-hydroxylase, mitochondrial [Patella vulgata]